MMVCEHSSMLALLALKARVFYWRQIDLGMVACSLPMENEDTTQMLYRMNGLGF